MRASWGFCFRTWPFCHFSAASRPRVCHCISLPIPACKTPAKPLQFPLTKALTKLCAVPLDHMTNLASQPASRQQRKQRPQICIDRSADPHPETLGGLLRPSDHVLQGKPAEEQMLMPMLMMGPK